MTVELWVRKLPASHDWFFCVVLSVSALHPSTYPVADIMKIYIFQKLQDILTNQGDRDKYNC